ncbi:MAG: helix-turn-helix transcriptional regulator [Crocinitomicaceae bacterium]|jgi:transcriptional regulator with XRE-family HTH domain|nr:helix-turn-helix transcriptional regulator [Crocinitomicaceae bacterium]MDP4739615.1 helix-turn-helix transcriptional regulator [Crocinitomicaceae bacterium]MDP4799252.1 helix-turn-helix transcriptional regulator [Crocinitomicaceae bacterium]MDP4805534.1 helix-turn-helix transcriptional regulator [Crocinitomicaceae bacterium]MDP4867938.1 helix-turn-helix transcriptional regulator [Crocinitomicaceae bacterium]
MNTKSSNSAHGEIETAFRTILSFDNEQDQLELEAKIIMAKFLEKIQEIAAQKGLKKKDLALKIGTSASYITQLYRGHKLLNLMTLAKFQRVLDIEFDIAIKGSEQIKNPAKEETIEVYSNTRYASDRSGEFSKRPLH